MILSEHVFKFGDWCENSAKERCRVIATRGTGIKVVFEYGQCSPWCDAASFTHLPDCTSFDWQPPATSEHVWKIGDWAAFHTDRYLIVGVEESVVSGIDRSLRVHTNLLKSKLEHLPDCDSWTWQPPSTIQLKEGCWYERRDVKVVGPAKKIDAQPFGFMVNRDAYRIDGTFMVDRFPCEFDLIREVPAPVPKYLANDPLYVFPC